MELPLGEIALHVSEYLQAGCMLERKHESFTRNRRLSNEGNIERNEEIGQTDQIVRLLCSSIHPSHPS